MRAEAVRRTRLRLGIGPQLIALGLVLGLAGAMAIRPTKQLLEQRGRISQMSRELRRLDEANNGLGRYIRRLRDPDYIEQQAREEMGLVRPGETTYVVVPPAHKAGRAERGGAGRGQQGSGRRRPGWLERLFGFLGWR